MPSEHVEVLKVTWDQLLSGGEIDWSLIGTDFEIHDHDAIDQGSYRGPEGFAEWLGDWDAAWSEWSIGQLEFVDAGERVIALFEIRATGRESGIELSREDAIVYAFDDGKVVRIDYYNNAAEAFAAAGVDREAPRVAPES